MTHDERKIVEDIIESWTPEKWHFGLYHYTTDTRIEALRSLLADSERAERLEKEVDALKSVSVKEWVDILRCADIDTLKKYNVTGTYYAYAQAIYNKLHEGGTE